jgi:hypothetical protein
MFIENLRSQPKLGGSTLISILGQVINIIGLLIGQLATSRSTYNIYGMSWYFAFLYFIWASSILITIGKGTMTIYKGLLNSITIIVTISIPLDIDQSLRRIAISTNNVVGIGAIVNFVALLFILLPIVINRIT